ncbi:MAG: hypothetical protein FWF92_02845 [Oscillospiraceae bacterium]|nr:hypothetical protein [Oscillospiraceae bacterium]
MFRNMSLSNQNLDFDLQETKKNINNYFINIEKVELELAKLMTQKGLTANYDFENEYSKQPYIPIGKDSFNLSAKEIKEEELKQLISSYYWAKTILSEKEQYYIAECFINHRYENELVDLLGFNSSDSLEFKRLKRSAIYKFADFLNMIVKNS